jgi:hypothetical protein
MKILIVITFVSLSFNAAAAPFKNLGFDQPEYPSDEPSQFPGKPFSIDVGAWVRPGWQSSPQSGVGYNLSQPFAGISSLLDGEFRDTHFGLNAKAPVVGSYSLGIWPGSGAISPDGSTFPFTLRQTGDIPVEAQSLRFLYHGNSLKVSVGGVERAVHFAENRASGDPEIGDLHYFAVDVGLWAGQTAELKFEFFSAGYDDFGEIPRRSFEPNAQMHVLDDLSFSPLPAVPEPQTWALLGVGLAVVMWSRKP